MEFITLEDAQKHLRENWKKGTNCPCCKQYVKLYKRKLNSTMVRGLIAIFKMGDGWHNWKTVASELGIFGGGDFSKLVYWGFIENQPNTNPKTKDSGFWGITQKGKDFVKGCTATVPKYANIYNGQLMGFSEERTTIQGALGDHFDYNELMNS